MERERRQDRNEAGQWRQSSVAIFIYPWVRILMPIICVLIGWFSSAGVINVNGSIHNQFDFGEMNQYIVAAASVYLLYADEGDNLSGDDRMKAVMKCRVLAVGNSVFWLLAGISQTLTGDTMMALPYWIIGTAVVFDYQVKIRTFLGPIKNKERYIKLGIDIVLLMLTVAILLNNCGNLMYTVNTDISAVEYRNYISVVCMLVCLNSIFLSAYWFSKE